MKRNGHVTLLWEDTDYFILKGKQMFFSFGREASNTKQHGNKPELILVWIFSTVVKTWDIRFSGKVLLLLKKNLHGWEKRTALRQTGPSLGLEQRQQPYKLISMAAWEKEVIWTWWEEGGRGGRGGGY